MQQIESRFKRKTASQIQYIFVVDPSGNPIYLSSQVWAIYLSKDGSAFVPTSATTLSLIAGLSGTGIWALAPSATDIDCSRYCFLIHPVNNPQGSATDFVVAGDTGFKDITPAVIVAPIVSAAISSPTSAKVVMPASCPPLQVGARITFVNRGVSADVGAFDNATKTVTLSDPGSVGAYQTAFSVSAIGGIGGSGGVSLAPFAPTLSDVTGVFSGVTGGDVVSVDAPGGD